MLKARGSKGIVLPLPCCSRTSLAVSPDIGGTLARAVVLEDQSWSVRVVLLGTKRRDENSEMGAGLRCLFTEFVFWEHEQFLAQPGAAGPERLFVSGEVSPAAPPRKAPRAAGTRRARGRSPRRWAVLGFVCLRLRCCLFSCLLSLLRL